MRETSSGWAGEGRKLVKNIGNQERTTLDRKMSRGICENQGLARIQSRQTQLRQNTQDNLPVFAWNNKGKPVVKNFCDQNQAELSPTFARSKSKQLVSGINLMNNCQQTYHEAISKMQELLSRSSLVQGHYQRKRQEIKESPGKATAKRHQIKKNQCQPYSNQQSMASTPFNQQSQLKSNFDQTQSNQQLPPERTISDYFIDSHQRRTANQSRVDIQDQLCKQFQRQNRSLCHLSINDSRQSAIMLMQRASGDIRAKQSGTHELQPDAPEFCAQKLIQVDRAKKLLKKVMKQNKVEEELSSTQKMAIVMKSRPQFPIQDEIRVNVRKQITQTKSIKAMQFIDGAKSITKHKSKTEMRMSNRVVDFVQEGMISSQSFEIEPKRQVTNQQCVRTTINNTDEQDLKQKIVKNNLQHTSQIKADCQKSPPELPSPLRITMNKQENTQIKSRYNTPAQRNSKQVTQTSEGTKQNVIARQRFNQLLQSAIAKCKLQIHQIDKTSKSQLQSAISCFDGNLPKGGQVYRLKRLMRIWLALKPPMKDERIAVFIHDLQWCFRQYLCLLKEQLMLFCNLYLLLQTRGLVAAIRYALFLCAWECQGERQPVGQIMKENQLNKNKLQQQEMKKPQPNAVADLSMPHRRKEISKINYERATNAVRFSPSNLKNYINYANPFTYKTNTSMNETANQTKQNRLVSNILQPIQPYLEVPFSHHPLIQIAKTTHKVRSLQHPRQSQYKFNSVGGAKGQLIDAVSHLPGYRGGATLFYQNTGGIDFNPHSSFGSESPSMSKRSSRKGAGATTGLSNQRNSIYRNSFNQMQTTKPSMDLPIIKNTQVDHNIYMQAVADMTQRSTLSKRLRERMNEPEWSFGPKRQSISKPTNKILNIQHSKTNSIIDKNGKMHRNSQKLGNHKKSKGKYGHLPKAVDVATVDNLLQESHIGDHSITEQDDKITSYLVNKRLSGPEDQHEAMMAWNSQEPQSVIVQARLRDPVQQQFEMGEDAPLAKADTSLCSIELKPKQKTAQNSVMQADHQIQAADKQTKKQKRETNQTLNHEILAQAQIAQRSETKRHVLKLQEIGNGSPSKNGGSFISTNKELGNVPTNFYENKAKQNPRQLQKVTKFDTTQGSNLKFVLNKRHEGLSHTSKFQNNPRFIPAVDQSRNTVAQVLSQTYQSNKQFKSQEKDSPNKKTSLKNDNSPGPSGTKHDQAKVFIQSAQKNTKKQELQKTNSSHRQLQMTKKEVTYRPTKFKLGQGKNGPVELIIYKQDLFALKKIGKKYLDNPKKIQHLKNEKVILEKLKMIQEEFKKGTFSREVVDGILAMTQNDMDEYQFLETKDSSQRHSYLVVEEEKPNLGKRQPSIGKIKELPPLPLNYIVNLENTFIDQENINFVFEYLPGRDLYWLIQNEMNAGKLGKDDLERWVTFYASQVLCALETLQSFNIIYRDLKPENVMIDRNGMVKLIDFGFAKLLTQANNFRTTTNCGTVGYTAPEVLLGISIGYSFEADLWSFGILICELFQQKLPYENTDSPYEIHAQCVKGDMKLPKGINHETRDLLQCLFQVDPYTRISLQNVKGKQFFKKVDWSRMHARDVDPSEIPYKPDMKTYNDFLSRQNEFPVVSNVLLRRSDSEHSPSTPRQGGPLGDFTITKVNREFEHF